MILHFMGNEDEESSKLNNKEKRVLRWVWAALLAFFMWLLALLYNLNRTSAAYSLYLMMDRGIGRVKDRIV